MKKCPTCSSSRRSRKKRNGLLKLIPQSHLYSCHKCGTRYLYSEMFGFPIKIKGPKKNFKKSSSTE